MIGSTERKYLDICQVRLWEVRMELESYAELFRTLGGEDLNSERMIGVGIAFDRLSKRIDRVNEIINNKVYAGTSNLSDKIKNVSPKP